VAAQEATGLELALAEPLEDLRGSELRALVRQAEESHDTALLEHALDSVLAVRPGDEYCLLVAAKLRWSQGRRDEARALVAEHPAAAVRLELAAGDPGRGLELLDEIGDPGAQLLEKVAGALRHRGQLSAAAGVYRRIDDPRGDAIEGELRVLKGEWSPAGGRAPTASAPAAGRVLHLLGRSLPHAVTGYAVRSQYVMEAQRSAGLDPTAVTRLGFPEGDADRVERIAGLRYHRIGPGASGPARLDDRLDENLRALDALARELRPAVLQPATDFGNALLALHLRDRIGVPVVYEVRGFWEDSWLSRQPDPSGAAETDAYRLRRDRERDCMLAADRVVTLGEAMRREISARGVPEERIAVVPNAVDPDRFAPATADPSLVRKLGLDGADAVIGYVSSFYGFEGIGHLLHAAALLRDRGRRMKVLLVGDGREREPLERLAAELALERDVVFAGRVPHDEIAAHYALMDVFVVPREDVRVTRLVTPLKPFEALAAGRAVVAADLPALREIVEPGRTGLTFRAGDPGDLADVLEELTGDPGRRAELAAAGREWVLRERTWEGNGRRYRALFEDLADGA
jgi:glycosyltransferase involved in cell wall biosynthesis